MRILTETNQAVCLDALPDRLETNLHYTALDYSDDVDFTCAPVMFLQQSRKPRATIEVGRYRLILPVDWSILIGDREHGECELVSVEEAVGRDFDALCLNPWSGLVGNYLPLSINPDLANNAFFAPKTMTRQLLAIPLHDGGKPLCVFAAQSPIRFPEALDIATLFA